MPFPEGVTQLTDGEKETLLASFPFTKHYLDSAARKSDPEGWQAENQRLARSLREEMRSKYGDNWESVCVYPQAISPDLHGIFGNMAWETKYARVRDAFLLGADLGEKNALLLLSDIVKAFKEQKTFDDLTPFKPGGNEELGVSIFGILRAGVYFKNYPNVPNIPKPALVAVGSRRK